MELEKIKSEWEWAIEEGFNDEQLGRSAKKAIPRLIKLAESQRKALEYISELNSLWHIKEIANRELEE